VSDLHRNSLTELVAGLRARRFSSVELVRAYLERIDRHQGALNAFISVTREQALREAQAADRAQGHLLHRGRTHHRGLAHARQFRLAL
jgi:aspartyl-tRNA(Asn)/glutamyl-tRNA(Gln) amidotransferase subunit A